MQNLNRGHVTSLAGESVQHFTQILRSAAKTEIIIDRTQARDRVRAFGYDTWDHQVFLVACRLRSAPHRIRHGE